MNSGQKHFCQKRRLTLVLEDIMIGQEGHRGSQSQCKHLVKLKLLKKVTPKISYKGVFQEVISA